MRWPTIRVEMKGSLIRVDAQDEAVYFRVHVSHSVRIDEATGQHFPLAGGENYDLALMAVASAPAPVDVRRVARILRRLHALIMAEAPRPPGGAELHTSASAVVKAIAAPAA